MKRSLQTAAAVFAGILFFAAIAPPASAQFTESQGAGYAAGITCSAVFRAGRTLEQVMAEELRHQLTEGEISVPIVDRKTKSVTVLYGADRKKRIAVHHEPFGTVLLPEDATLDFVARLPVADMPWPAGDPAKIQWPDGDLLPDLPLPKEVKKKKLDKAVELAFTGEKYAPHKTLGVVVVYKDQIIAERYAPGWGVHTQYRSWSTAKSITNALVGIVVGQGKLRIRDPAPIPEWQGSDDPRRQITIENLLHMSSGLESEGSATGTAYWGGVDTSKEIVKTKLEAEPGSRWKYSNYDTLLLMLSIKNVLDNNEAYLTLPRRALLNKIGMRHTFPEIDPYGNYILSSQVYTTPRDLARLGLLYLHDGVWNGERILPEGWVRYSATPAPAKTHEDERDWGYGAQFWLFGTDPRVPVDTFSTAGARGQLSTIVPSRDLVVVRTGLDPRAGDKWDQVEFVKDVLKAIGEG